MFHCQLMKTEDEKKKKSQKQLEKKDTVQRIMMISYQK